MEASALHPPARFARLTSSPALLRLRSDEQLVTLLRGGSPDAFRAIHDRYQQRLFAYVRQMLGPRPRQDAEDVLQDVFARTYTMLRNDDREINLRPWLYRVAHNRCIDHLRRPGPATAELVETSAGALHDPFEEVQRREDLQRLVTDIARLPDQQKSALLLREINGLSYRELAEALEVTVPAVKSLLVRARVELVETAQAREASCGPVRDELALACDTRSARPSPRARRHLRDCVGCQEYHAGMRGMRRSFAALSPVAVAGPFALAAKLVGLGSSGGGATAGGGGLAGGVSSGGVAGGVTSGGLAVGTAGKIAAVVSTAAITAGGAVEIERRAGDRVTAAPAADTRPAAGDTSQSSLPAARSAPRSDAGSRSLVSGAGSPSATRRRDADASGGAGARRGDERRKPPRTRRPASRAVGGERSAGTFPAAGGAPVAGPGPDSQSGPGSAGGGAPIVDSPAVPAAPVTAPDRAPAAPTAAPVVAETAPSAAVDVPPTTTPTIEVPVAPPVKEKLNGNLKPDKVVGPKPGRGPKAVGPKPGRGPTVDIGL